MFRGWSTNDGSRWGFSVEAKDERAIAAYARAGFVEEGRRRAAVYRNGAWHDDVHMGLLRDEWERLR